MPIYEYKCTKCSKVFEEMQTVHADTVHTCPDCGKPAKRLISPAGIIFKGTGFYKTDNRSPSHTHPKADKKPGQGSSVIEEKPAGDVKKDSPADKPATTVEKD